jgi:hypothetical protein
MQQQAFHAWRRQLVLQRQQRQLQEMHGHRVLQHAWQLWVHHGPKLQKQHAAASKAFAALGCKLMKQWGLRAVSEQLQEQQQACQHLQQQTQLLMLSRWKQLAAVAARRERLLAVRQAARSQHQLQRCLVHWWHQTVAAGRQAAAKQAAALQVGGTGVHRHLSTCVLPAATVSVVC